MFTTCLRWTQNGSPTHFWVPRITAGCGERPCCLGLSVNLAPLDRIIHFCSFLCLKDDDFDIWEEMRQQEAPLRQPPVECTLLLSWRFSAKKKLNTAYVTCTLPRFWAWVDLRKTTLFPLSAQLGSWSRQTQTIKGILSSSGHYSASQKLKAACQ